MGGLGHGREDAPWGSASSPTPNPTPIFTLGAPRWPPTRERGRSPTRERGRPARILVPRWRWWSVSATLPAGSHPAGVNGIGQSE